MGNLDKDQYTRYISRQAIFKLLKIMIKNDNASGKYYSMSSEDFIKFKAKLNLSDWCILLKGAYGPWHHNGKKVRFDSYDEALDYCLKNNVQYEKIFDDLEIHPNSIRGKP